MKRPRSSGANLALLPGLPFLLFGCATQPAPAIDDAPGLLAGIFHGLIALPALIASVVIDTRIYAFPNAGFIYDLGFCFGFGVGLLLIVLPIIPFVGGFLVRKG